jgi:hypothetical protein
MSWVSQATQTMWMQWKRLTIQKLNRKTSLSRSVSSGPTLFNCPSDALLGGFRVVGAMSASGVIRGLVQSHTLIMVDPNVHGNFIRIVELTR